MLTAPVPVPSTHESLLLAVLERGRQHWAAFYHRYERIIRAWYQQLRLPESTCDDLMQDLFGEMPCKLHSYQRVDKAGATNPFRSWLRAVVRNSGIDHIHERTRKSADHAGPYGDLDRFPDRRGAEVLASKLRDANLRDALAAAERVRRRVHSETWAAYELAYLYGRPAKVVAELTGKTEGAIYVIVHRVNKSIREEYHALLETPAEPDTTGTEDEPTVSERRPIGTLPPR